MTITPTKAQQDAIDYDGGCIIVAVPGSGKTFTISQKIKIILSTHLDYQCVIAISYTNKASDELKHRCLAEGADRKGSFFGTIDAFFLSEIILPFGTHIFGNPIRELEVVKLSTLENCISVQFQSTLKDSEDYEYLIDNCIELLKDRYINGQVILEAFGFLSLYIFEHSLACRRYLKAKYTNVFVDEYQDCGYWQHKMFRNLINLGINGVAVGDIDQSIFGFAKKDSKYLLELLENEKSHRTFPLSDNHRCHNSIVNYSARFLSQNTQILPTEEINVFHKHAVGSEIEIANWLSRSVVEFSERYQVSERNKIAILVRSRRTGSIIAQNIGIPFKPITQSSLDNDSSIWGAMFKKILSWVFNANATKYELVESYLNIDFQATVVRNVMNILGQIESVAKSDPFALAQTNDLFLEIAYKIFPQHRESGAINRLQDVLKNRHQLESFMPPDSTQVLIMTLHKSKGLEFDIVFHLDLYKWILPQYKGDIIQDKNLHYVGITRAKKCCILCTSTQRHNSNQQIKSAEISPFLYRDDLVDLRIKI